MQMAAIAGAGGQAGNVPSPRLVRAAHEFEGLMLKELLKPMTNASELTGDSSDSDSGGGSGGALGEFASEVLGQALSREGGFGIADRVVHSLSHSGSVHGNGNAAAEGRSLSVIRPAQ